MNLTIGIEICTDRDSIMISSEIASLTLLVNHPLSDIKETTTLTIIMMVY